MLDASRLPVFTACSNPLGWAEAAVKALQHYDVMQPSSDVFGRGYRSRWEMFVNHAFDPHEELKRNSHGALEFATNKPERRHDFDLYLHSRNEDVNALS